MSRSLVGLSVVSLALVGSVACSDQGFVSGAFGDGAGPDIAVTPSALIYPAATETQVQTFVITNEGTSQLDVDHLELDAPGTFTMMDPGSFSLQPDESANVDVAYTSDLTTDENIGNVWVYSDDPDESVLGVDLTGLGVAPIIRIDPDQYDFGNPYIGCTEDQPYTISNDGTADLVVDSLELAGSN